MKHLLVIENNQVLIPACRVAWALIVTNTIYFDFFKRKSMKCVIHIYVHIYLKKTLINPMVMIQALNAAQGNVWSLP